LSFPIVIEGFSLCLFPRQAEVESDRETDIVSQP